MTEFIDLNQLFRLSVERSKTRLKFAFGKSVLSIQEQAFLPQIYQDRIAQSQGQLSGYFRQIIANEKELDEKMSDKSKSASELAILQKQQTENSVRLSRKLMSQDRDLLKWNLVYIEAVAKLAPGRASELLDESIAMLEADGTLDDFYALLDEGEVEHEEPPEQKKEKVVIFFVARASLLIRNALDDIEKKFQSQIGEQVRKTIENQDSLPMTDRANVLKNMEKIPALAETNSTERKIRFDAP